MLWDDAIPRLVVEGEAGEKAEITVITGRLAGAEEPPSPPPASWASRAEADLAIWHIALDEGASWTLPKAAGADSVRTLYVFDGDGSLRIAGHEPVHGRGTGIVVDSQVDLDLSAVDGPTEVLMLQGRPIGEPVAQYGPFVMNTKAQIQQAFTDYQQTQFGGWPWATDDPVHPATDGRFARHADGRREEQSQ